MAGITTTFDRRANTPGYDEKGFPIAGAGSTRDESRRMVQSEKNVIRQAQKNAKDALRSGDMEAWEKWSARAGGKTFGINDSDQLNRLAEANTLRNVNNAANVNGGGGAQEGVAGGGNVGAQGGAGADNMNADAVGAQGGARSNSNMDQAKMSFQDQEEQDQLIKIGQGVFGEQGKIDKAKSLLDRYVSDDKYTEEMLRKDAKLMGADPDIAIAEGNKKKTEFEAEKTASATNSANRSEAQNILSKFEKGEITESQAMEAGAAIGGDPNIIREKLDSIVGIKQDELSADESDAMAKQRRIEETNRGILGYTRVDPNSPENIKDRERISEAGKARRLDLEAKSEAASAEIREKSYDFAEERRVLRDQKNQVAGAFEKSNDPNATAFQKAEARAILDRASDQYIVNAAKEDGNRYSREEVELAQSRLASGIQGYQERRILETNNKMADEAEIEKRRAETARFVNAVNSNREAARNKSKSIFF